MLDDSEKDNDIVNNTFQQPCCAVYGQKANSFLTRAVIC